MRRIIATRKTGKTVSLMRQAILSDAKFACRNIEYAKTLAFQCGLDPSKIISYDDLLTRGRKYDNVVIDEIEEFVRYTITNTGTLVGYTLTIG